MPIRYPPSSPIRNKGVVRKVAGEVFQQTYLSGSRLNHTKWNSTEKSMVKLIKKVPESQEKLLYTGDAPLLRLLNHISESFFNKYKEGKALVFGPECTVKNPFTDQCGKPDITVEWVKSDTFPEINYSDKSPSKNWTELAAVGEVKVSKSGQYQLASYLRNLLQFHPELNAVLGFTARAVGYALFYHDAAVIHRSEFGWELGPLYAFIETLYTRPFQDTSMKIQNAKAPTWVTKIGNDVYLSTIADAHPGPGQRRYTTKAVNHVKNEVVFIKDIWRDESRLFFEGLLLKQAHEGQSLCGLILPNTHGYVLDETQTPIRTTLLNPEPAAEQAKGRFKMRLVTKEIGGPLDGVHSLSKFLCAMYDACVVQRNLYRKCQILHRDISEGNIMFVPDTDGYRERNREGYAEVRFVNQVLAKDKNVDPEPACLVIDLGNGADLKAQRGQDALTERTGTPKFIARSVSSGRLLDDKDFSSKGVDMPSVEGSLDEYQQFMHSTGYKIRDSPGPATQSAVEFAHRLFHDAESTFWVIAWILVRSIKAGSEPEEEPQLDFCDFYHTMRRHFPVPGCRDSRLGLGSTGKTSWEFILHPSLARLAPMLAGMFEYIRPEWAYRQELNPEHVHEALMRLLLTEIANIKEYNTDIAIAIGGRKIPPPPPSMGPLPRSTMSSLSKDATRSRTSNSMKPQASTAARAESEAAGSSKQQNTSLSAEPQTSDLSHGMEKMTLRSNTAAAVRSEQPGLPAQPEEQENTMVWQREPCELQEPE